MNWIEIGKDRGNLPKNGDYVVLAYLDGSNKLKYTIATSVTPNLTYYDSGTIIYGTYIAYAGPLPRFNYSNMYDLVKQLFDFSEEREV